jgi:hypothetical protein
MDVFRQDAFSAITMTAVVDKIGYIPSFLGDMPGLFTPMPVSTVTVFIEERGTTAALIQTSARGSPPKQVGNEKRKVRSFSTVRLAEQSRIMADQLQGIRAFGSTTELQSLQSEVARRQFIMKSNIALTMENLRLGAVQGLVLDADGSTIVDWAVELGQTIPAEVNFDLGTNSATTGAIRAKCDDAKRSILRALQKGQTSDSVTIVGLCGDAFWSALVSNQEVRQTYLATQAAADLRGGTAFSMLNYGGITFVNYRGTDDGTTVGINTDKCKFFPLAQIGATSIFQMAQAPAERFEFVNTPGLPLYSWIVPDDDRDMFADIEMYTYPLPVCVLPQALYRGRRAA